MSDRKVRRNHALRLIHHPALETINPKADVLPWQKKLQKSPERVYSGLLAG